jgi:hypothetical protein
METPRISRTLCVRVRGQSSRYAVAVGSVLKYVVIDPASWIAVEFGTLADVVHYIARWEGVEPQDVSVEECR